MDLKALLANQTFLYVVLGVSIASLFGYVVGQRTNAVLFFLLAGYVTSHFSKNMTIILLVPLLLTNFVFSFNRIREGLEGQKKNAAAEKIESRIPSDKELDEAEGKDDDVAPAPEKVDVNVAARVNKKDSKQKRGGNASGDDSAEVQPHPEVDKKKTKEMAYSYFENVLGDDGINQMSKGMSDMVDKHEKLQKMIETMAPIIDQASGLLDKVNSTDLGNIENMVKKMGGLLGNIGL